MPPILIMLPVLLFLLSAAGIFVLMRTRPGVGYAWLWSSLVSIVVLAWVAFTRWWLPLQLPITGWLPFGDAFSLPVFRLDFISWTYVFALAALTAAVMLTDSARLQRDSGPFTWALTLAISGVGMLALMAGNPLTLVLTWTAVDLVEFIGIFRTQTQRDVSRIALLAFAIRVGGTLLVIAAMLYAAQLGILIDFDRIPPQVAPLFLLAAGLRLGVLPLNLPFYKEIYIWRGMSNVLRMVGPLSSLMVLARMPTDAVPVEWRGMILFFSTLAAVYGAVMWFGADPAQSGRPYWILALAALAVVSVARGVPQASLGWGTAMVLSGSVLFLHSAQNRRMAFIPYIALFGISGLPFTPVALGLSGVIAAPFDGTSILFLLVDVFLILGMARRILIERDELYDLERWVHTIYPIGLILLIVAQWAVLVSDWRSALIVGVWWASLLSVVFSLLGGVLLMRYRRILQTSPAEVNWIETVSKPVGSAFSAFFRLDWLYRLLAWGMEGLQGLVRLLTQLFEGDGGILWALVMLGLFLSLVMFQGAP